MRTLVLDQSYQPHKIVSWQRAVTLLFAGKVEVVDAYDHDVRSVTLTIKMPAVVRLLRAIRGIRRPVKFSRINVLTRDRFQCQYCGRKLPIQQLNHDHVVPRSQGGRTTWENIVTSCYPCNARKAHRTPEQAGMRLLQRPIAPRSLPVTVLRVDLAGTSVPDSWASWVYWQGALSDGS